MQLFFELTPERVLLAIESFGERATGSCLALNSLENRVYEVELEDGSRKVLKFYRPGRWPRETILEEHAFLKELVEAEIPVVAPIDLGDDRRTLGEIEGMFYCAFPKMRGRAPQELPDEQLLQMGRLLARMHTVGGARPAQFRRTLDAATFGAASLTETLGGRFLPLELASRYRAAATLIIEVAERLYRGLPLHRIHGDCHMGNLLWNTDGPFFLDFDDMAMGPAVQDVWMLVPGRGEEADRQRARLLDGYEQMRGFDRTTLRLIEPLRGLRILHYSAWIASHWEDPSFPRTFAEFPSFDYWARETEALEAIGALSERALA